MFKNILLIDMTKQMEPIQGLIKQMEHYNEYDVQLVGNPKITYFLRNVVVFVYIDIMINIFVFNIWWK